MTAEADPLLVREVDRVLAELERAMPRVLADNPEGSALLGSALYEGLLLGLAAGAVEARVPLQELRLRADAWTPWQRVREIGAEGPAWPGELAASSPSTVERARERALAAGQELGLHGRALRRIGVAGEQAAEAGAALVRELTEPAGEPVAAGAAIPASAGPLQPDGTVRVALAANEAEAELLRGLLSSAGIPSTWRRTGGDLPELLGAGYREIYVPAAAREDAEALLSSVETTAGQGDPVPTRRVGLERTGLRLVGKSTAALIAVGSAFGLTIGTASIGVTVAAALAALVLSAALVVWSERARA